MTEPPGTTSLPSYPNARPDCDRMWSVDQRRAAERRSSLGAGGTPSSGLNQAQFVAAVHHAFRNLTNNQALRSNSLLQTKLVLRRCDPDALSVQRVQALQALLREAVARLQQSPRRQKHFQALAITYLEPAASPEHTASLIGLPFMAYRRSLQASINAVAAYLWQQELVQ